MVMKDKLYKSNHKGLYYKTRKALIASAIVLSVFTAVSVPTYINIKKAYQPERRELRNQQMAEVVETDIKFEVKNEMYDVKAISDEDDSGVHHVYKYIKNN